MAAARKKTKPKTDKKPKPTRSELIEEALDYRKQGYSAVEIGAAMKLDAQEVQSLVEEGLEKTQIDNPRTAILLQIQRYQDAQKAISQNVANGEPEAIRLMRDLERELAELKVKLDPQMRDIFGNAALFELGKVWTAGGARKRGRPPHQPTVATVAMCQALILAGTDKEKTAKVMGIDTDTLNKYYGPIMDIAKARVLGKLTGTVIEGADKDPRLALELLSRQKVEGFMPVVSHTPNGGAGKGDEYNPAAGAGAAAGNKEVVHRVVVEGGLPIGSTPERPEGTEYDDVPPEERRV